MPKLIAIIDDEREMEDIYSILLEDMVLTDDIQLKFFSDARLFVLWLKFNQPDLILSDITMPFLSGTELGRRIRETGKSICTYFVSGHLEDDYKETMKELGVSRYLSKPINFNDMVDYIKTDLNLLG